MFKSVYRNSPVVWSVSVAACIGWDGMQWDGPGRKKLAIANCKCWFQLGFVLNYWGHGDQRKTVKDTQY